MSGRNKDSSEAMLFGLHNSFYIGMTFIYGVRRGIHTIHPKLRGCCGQKYTYLAEFTPLCILNTQIFHVEWNRILQYINEQLPHLTHYFNVETARYKNTLDQPYSPNLRSAIPPHIFNQLPGKLR